MRWIERALLTRGTLHLHTFEADMRWIESHLNLSEHLSKGLRLKQTLDGLKDEWVMVAITYDDAFKADIRWIESSIARIGYIRPFIGFKADIRWIESFWTILCYVHPVFV